MDILAELGHIRNLEVHAGIVWSAPSQSIFDALRGPLGTDYGTGTGRLGAGD